MTVSDNFRFCRWLLRARLFLLAFAFAPSLIDAQTPCPAPRLPAYAHNDYANARPLTDALALGFRGAEADVFLVDGVLRLGHDRRRARTGASLEAQYFAPLDSVFGRCGAPRSGELPFLLAVEIKEDSRVTYDSLTAVLGRHPRLHGVVDVVLVGWFPDAATLATSATRVGRHHRLRRPDTAWTTPLDPTVRLLSVDYGKTAGRWWVRAAGRRRWMTALRAAKAANPDRRLRVHNVPVRAELYRELLTAGVDLIGTKDLDASAALLRRLSAER